MLCFSLRGNLQIWLSGLILFGLASGCTLFRPKEEQSRRQSTDLRTLDTVTATRESVQLEVLIVERPLGDPLLEKDLWRELDTTSPFELHQRFDFEQQGFRVGVSGSNPSMALQTLLGSDTSLSAVEYSPNSPIGKRIPLPLGDEIELQTSPQYEKCSFLVPNIRTDAVALQEYENVRCLFRLKAQEIEPGWVQLTLLPELHHGQMQTRRVATPGGWQLRNTQEIKPIFPQQFEMKLCTGEIAVISMMPLRDTKDDDLGYRFFVGADDQQQKQRVMIIRFAGMGQSRAVRVDRESTLLY